MRRSNLTTRRVCAVLTAALLLSLSAAVAADELAWRPVDPDNTVFMQLTEGLVIIELNPAFAPQTVRQFKQLARDRFYDGLPFYRVIDGFVAQGGDGSDLGKLSEIPLIDAEFEIEWKPDLPWTPVQSPDPFAPETGLSAGFAVGRNPSKNTAWLTHCPGTVAMARNDDPDSSRTDFYIVIGQAPRYLDRNLNVFGRVVFGMDVVQRIHRGPALNNGIIPDETVSTRISKLRMLEDVPDDEKFRTFVIDTGDEAFVKLLEDRRNRKQKFFHNKPPAVLDVCQVPVNGRITR
jgi:peptidylprolyl isomerase